MARLIDGQNQGGQLVWKFDDDTIVPVRLAIDSEGVLVPVPTGPGSTEEKQDDIITELQTVRILDLSNSTEEDLGNGGIFEGEWIDVLNYASLSVELLTDQLSAVDGFKVESSDDGVTVNHTHSFSINAGTNHHYTFTLTGKYYRIRYINGVTPTTSFKIGTSLSKVDQSHQHTHGVEFVIDSDHPADLVRSVLTAKRADNIYSNIRSTNGNNLKISLEELESIISSNSNSQLNVTQYDSSGLETHRIADTPVSFEDTNFVTGDSPIILDLNAALGRNAIRGFVINDGPGNFTISFSTNGSDWGDELTRKSGEKLDFDNISVDSLRITWVADSSYRVVAI
jgi:hypothetical protein